MALPEMTASGPKGLLGRAWCACVEPSIRCSVGRSDRRPFSNKGSAHHAGQACGAAATSMYLQGWRYAPIRPQNASVDLERLQVDGNGHVDRADHTKRLMRVAVVRDGAGCRKGNSRGPRAAVRIANWCGTA